jgi:opacity protein-like surface antigen
MLEKINSFYLFLPLFALMGSVNANDGVNILSNKSWQGTYVSGSIGSLINKSDIYTNHTQPYFPGMTPGGYSSVTTQADSHETVTPGFQMGHNWIHNNYLLGLEADYSPSKKSNTACNATPDSPKVCNSSFYGWTNITSETKYFGTFKARLGYILNNFMFHLNAGYSYIENSNLISLNCPEGCGPWDVVPEVRGVKVSRKHFVPTYGFGGEYLLDSNLRIGLDYQFISSTQLSQNITHDPADLNQSIYSRISNDMQIVRFKIVYAF